MTGSGFFKGIAKAIFCFFTPFLWVIGISVGAVVALIIFIIYAIISLFLFFTGRSMLGDLPEDIRVKEMKEQIGLRKQMEVTGGVGVPENNLYNAPNPNPINPANPNPAPVVQDHPVYEAPKSNDNLISPDDIAYKAPEPKENKEEVENYEIPF